jgi:hypothetical protein
VWFVSCISKFERFLSKVPQGKRNLERQWREMSTEQRNQRHQKGIRGKGKRQEKG